MNNTVTINNISSDEADALLSIAHQSNGLKSVAKIQKEIKHKKFKKLLHLLVSSSIIIDSRNIYELFHDYSRFPLTSAHNWSKNDLYKNTNKHAGKSKVLNSKFTALLKKRKSTRLFSKEPLSKKLLLNLLGVANPANKFTPSAGALYPITIFVYLFKQTGDLKPGLYTSDLLQRVDVSHQLFCAMVGTSMTQRASGIILFVSDFTKVTFKYANRGYRHALLEAGHVAQNVCLFATEQKFGVCEYGGFNDRELARILNLNYPNQAIVTSILFGFPGKGKKYKEPYEDEQYFLKRELAIQRLSTRTFRYGDYVMPYYTSSAKYLRGNKLHSSFGLGSTVYEANLKALSEAAERHMSGMYRYNFYGKPKKNSFLPQGEQRERYLRSNRLQPYSYTTKRDWVLGKSLSSKATIYVPADFVFYPAKRCTSWKANSSGTAAHFKREKAIENALLELIERDALALIWYEKETPPQINSYPEDIAYRVRKLQENGRKVWFLDITRDSVPVILCVITSNEYPKTTTGCSASYVLSDALRKSFNEAEFVLHSWRFSKKEPINYKSVKSSTDHGTLNAHTNLIGDGHTKWLFSGKKTYTEHKLFSYKSLIKKFDPVYIDVGKVSGLSIVRVVSNKLVPLTFGYTSEIYRHPRMTLLQLKSGWGNVSTYPHPLA